MSVTTSTASISMSMLQCQPFVPAMWQTQHLDGSIIPRQKVSLGRFPTPFHRFHPPGIEDLNPSPEMWIKRDDLSSCDLSGNKVRKLEFLLADAIEQNCDTVITIGGIQSNHCRATAVAARQLGMDPHLILRTPLSTPVDLTGNLLWNRMVGSQIHTVTPKNYAMIGSNNLVDKLADDLQEKGKRPYKIPVGGSNALGSFGYMELIREINDFDIDFDHIVFACGSSGAGVAIGARLSGLKAKLHGIGVCYDEQFFYNHIREMATDLGVDMSQHGAPEDWITMYNGQGIGYAVNSNEELLYLVEVARKTGVVFDPVYAGKALYYFVKRILQQRPDVFKADDKVLFVHTGGTFGLYDKVDQIAALLPPQDIAPFKLD